MDKTKNNHFKYYDVTLIKKYIYFFTCLVYINCMALHRINNHVNINFYETEIIPFNVQKSKGKYKEKLKIFF